MTDKRELLARVKAATGPDRELDSLIDATFRIGLPHLPAWAWNNFPAWVPFGGGRTAVMHEDHNTGLHWESEHFTASTDAALAFTEKLLPRPGYHVRTMGQTDNGRWFCCVVRGWPTNYSASYRSDPMPNLPLAIIAATLTAVIAQETTND